MPPKQRGSKMLSYADNMKRIDKAKKAAVKTAKAEIAKSIGTRKTDVLSVPYVWNANNSTMSAAVSLTDKIENMTVGSANGQRDGNQINVKSSVLSINLTASVLATKPMIVTIFIGHVKAQPTVLPSAGALATIYDTGVSNTGDTGKTLELLYPLNRDRFRVRKYSFKISESVISGSTLYANNDFKVFMNKKIPLKYMKGKCKFFNDSGTGINKGLFMWAQATYVDSSQVGAVAPAEFPDLNYYVNTTYQA